MADQKISALLSNSTLTGAEFVPIVQPALDPKGNKKIIIADLMQFAPVLSVNGQIGEVELTAADVGALAAGDNISQLTNDVGYITGNQTITLSGDITGSGATSITTAIGNDKVLTAMIADANVTYAKIANGTGLSVIGRSANSGGVNADIVAVSDSEVLRRSGTSIGFGTIATAGIANSAITYAKIQNVTDARLLGNASGGAAAPSEITVSNGLTLASGALKWGGSLPDASTAVTKTTASYVTALTITDGSIVNQITDVSNSHVTNITLTNNRLRIQGWNAGLTATANYVDIQPGTNITFGGSDTRSYLGGSVISVEQNALVFNEGGTAATIPSAYILADFTGHLQNGGANRREIIQLNNVNASVGGTNALFNPATQSTDGMFGYYDHGSVSSLTHYNGIEWIYIGLSHDNPDGAFHLYGPVLIKDYSSVPAAGDFPYAIIYENNTQSDLQYSDGTYWFNITRPGQSFIDDTDSPYSIIDQERNYITYVDTSAGDVTISLSSFNISNHWTQTFVNKGTGTITFSVSGGSTFNGIDTTCDTQYGAVTVVYDSVNDIYSAFGALGSSGGGGVTSVDIDGDTTGLVFSGGPITTSGTFTVSGTLAVANGGTGLTSITSGQVLYGGSGAFASEAAFNYDASTDRLNVLTLRLGLGSVSGGRTIDLASSDTDAWMNIAGKGAYGVRIPNLFLVGNNGEYTDPNYQNRAVYISVTGADYRLTGGNGDSGVNKDFVIKAADGATTDANGRDLKLTAGTQNGAGIAGIVDITTGYGITATVSNAGTLTLSRTKSIYVFTGTSTTWTLPAVSGNTDLVFHIKNRGTGNITLTRAGSDNIYSSTTVTTFTILPGEAYMVYNDGTYWNVM